MLWATHYYLLSIVQPNHRIKSLCKKMGMKKVINVLPFAILLLLASCEKTTDDKDELEPYQVIQAQMIGTYDATCYYYSYYMHADSIPHAVSTDTTSSPHTYQITTSTGMEDDKHILANDTLFNLEDLSMPSNYYQSNYFSPSGRMGIEFIQPDSIYTYEKIGGGLGGGNIRYCTGKKRP